MTYVHDPGKVIGTILAHIEGSNPSSGTYRYYFQDNIVIRVIQRTPLIQLNKIQGTPRLILVDFEGV